MLESLTITPVRFNRPALLDGGMVCNGLVAKGYGYFANSAKTWLVSKEEHYANATSIFASTGVKITSSGRPYLGAANGSEEFM